MATGYFKVTPEELKQGSSNLRQVAGQILDQLSSSQREVQRLASSWEGAAQAQFDALMKEWDAGAKQVQQALDNTSNLLGKVGDEYAQTEAAAKATFSG